MKFGLTKRDDSFSNQIESFKKGISTVFDDFFTMPSGLFETSWSPAIDMESDKKTVTVKAEIPGMDEKDINVTIEQNFLTISGEKKEEKETECDDKRCLITERTYGSFHRSIRLPEGIKSDKAKAEFKNGVLTVTIPKEKSEETKKIKIDVK